MESVLPLDARMSVFVQLGRDGEIQPMTTSDWQSAVERLSVSDGVPIMVREILVEARETMKMGPWSYALFTRGLEHALKCAETAITLRAHAAGVPLRSPNGQPTTFAFRLKRLRQMQIIEAADHESWTRIRELRNLTAHPKQPFLLSPAAAIAVVQTIAKAIEQLFAARGGSNLVRSVTPRV